MSKILGYFTFIAIFISCLGLFGLASFIAEQRTKEIGIRKVLGASVASIFLLMTRKFSKWVLMANLIAWPIAYLIGNNWLREFAYRVDFGIWIFVFSGLAAFCVALFTVSYKSITAAKTIPIKTIKYE
jgi:putative ABC transport system permease protein